MITADDLTDRVTIEQPVADDAFDGAGSGTWALVDEVWANVQDVRPSRTEKLAAGINVAASPTRIIVRYRTDITTSMRFVLGARQMQIVGGPASIQQREFVEFMVEDYSPAGNLA